MSTQLVCFQCTQCGVDAFRYRDVYIQMMAEREQAWCVLCAPLQYQGPAPQREAREIVQALLAQFRANLAAHRASPAPANITQP